VSQQRFRRLLEIEGDLDRLYLYLGRIVQLLGRKADLFSLADGVYRWDRNPTIRQQWAYDYYGAAPSQPAERRAS
jgi:CRISPR type I-E-associated protein CasB/Cse2